MQKHLLRICISILLLHSSILNLKAQWVTIPDTAFVSYLQATFPACMNGNLLDTTCSGVVNEAYVFCSHRPIKDLTGIQYFDSLFYLYCSFDSLTSLPALPTSLTFLFCNNNQLNSLPALTGNLTDLDCSYNYNLTSLPVLPGSLTYLNCDYTQLSMLPTLPGNLVTLYCRDNVLTMLPTLPGSLTQLYCSWCLFTTLPVLPSSLTYLDCEFNQLTSLPTLPGSLTYLNCNDNYLTSMPALSGSLTYLACHSNQLTSLPVLPGSLTDLDCGGNLLTNLPALPGSLRDLNCSHNQLTNLPTLSGSLTGLNCSNNQLSSIPELPDSLDYFSCTNNSNLYCLPQLKKIKHISFYGTGITCLPNYPQSNQSSTPILASIPLCDPFNANGCSVYWNINGKVYNDTSGNCIKDIGETNIQNMKVNLYENGVLAQQNYSGGYGIYSFNTDMGTFETTIDTTGVPFDILCPASRFDTSVITALDSFDYDRDFAVQCKSGFDVGAWSLVSNSVFRPAHTAYINIHAGDWAQFWGQNCNTNNLSGQLVTTISGAATFISAAGGALTPIVSGNTLTYNISNWSAVNPNTDFNIIVQTDTTAPLGSQICFDVNVTPTAGDNNVSNNHLSHCFTVVSSYDPNVKEVSPVSSVDASDWLTYTIHFQNTGTATAEHIYVTDTLDANIDASSFQLLAYSHQQMVQIKENAVRFNFPNINLPDSNANEAASHGYVQYKVKLKNNLPVGTHISNTAFIYFDFNSPVVTNTTTNTIALTTGVGDVRYTIFDVRLFPNPTNDFVNIAVDEAMVKSKLTITDITGRKITVTQIEHRVTKIETSTYTNGVYFVTVESEKGRITKKLVVEK